jgi:hypothetical protein
MVALTYRAGSIVTSGKASAAGSQAVNAPVGVADNDYVVTLAYWETDTNTITTIPAGFTSLFRQVNTGAFMLEAFWKRAAAEPASYTWNAATGSQWRTLVSIALVPGSGLFDVKDAAAGSQADAVAITAQTAPTITPVHNGVMVLCFYGNFGGSNPTTFTGFTTNLPGALGGVCIAYAHQASIAATGTSRPSAGPGSQTYAAFHVALIDDAGYPRLYVPTYNTLLRM